MTVQVILDSKDQRKGTEVVLLSASDRRYVSYKGKLERYGFTGGKALFLQSENMLFVGVSKDVNNDVCEEIVVLILKHVESYGIKQCFIDLVKFPKVYHYVIAQAFLLAGYRFDRFKTSSAKGNKRDIEFSVNVSLVGVDPRVLNELSIIARNVNIARDLVNTPPNIADSTYLAEKAREYALGLKCVSVENYDNSFLKKENMNAFLAVNQASNSPAYMTHLHYKPNGATKNVVLVGKGLVYDTGGLSLKGSDYMTTMKADKSGACVVLASFLSIVELGFPVEVHAIMGITDNAIGNSSYRPDDVIYSREGKSIEVKNTDAEGRLVLVDCLSFAQDLNPDVLIDFATLTGACVVALGEYTSGVMGFNEGLKSRFVRCASEVNELAHSLPFNVHLDRLLESKIADVSNVSSSRYGGAITAGMFIGRFIREKYKQKWLHIDIAGPSFVEKEWGINPHGASGAAIRSCVNFVKKSFL